MTRLDSAIDPLPFAEKTSSSVAQLWRATLESINPIESVQKERRDPRLLYRKVVYGLHVREQKVDIVSPLWERRRAT